MLKRDRLIHLRDRADERYGVRRPVPPRVRIRTVHELHASLAAAPRARSSEHFVIGAGRLLGAISRATRRLSGAFRLQP